MAHRDGQNNKHADQKQVEITGTTQSSGKKRRKSLDRQVPKKPTRRTLMLGRLEASVWILAAAGLIYFGDGKTSIPYLVLRDTRIRRSWFCVGVALLGLNFISFLYIQIWVYYVKCETDNKAAPIAVACGTFSSLAALPVLCVAAWKVWGFLTPVILVVLYMAVFMVSPLMSLLAERPEVPKTSRED
eukprot:jgi/Botrbrau1/9927/Bobra.0012s0025.1